MGHTLEQTRNKKPMWVFEKNYLYFRELFPEIISLYSESIIYQDNLKTVIIRCLEISRYTTLISLQLTFIECPQIPPINMSVRLYHDAQLADVVSYQDIPRLIAPCLSNDKKNKENHKRQANILLFDLLSGCMKKNKLETVC